MASPPAIPPGPGLLRRSAKVLLGGLAFTLALALGLALFLPWDLIWPQVLARATAGNPRLSLGWRSLEEPSALGFTLRGLSLNATGRVAAEAESLALRLGPTPLALSGLTARTGRATVHLDRASLELGFSPLAVLRLTAGEELTVSLIQRRTLVAGGKTDLAKLLPESRLAGVVGIYADVAWQAWGGPPDKGIAEISAQAIALPDGRTAAGLAASAALEGDLLTLRELRLQEPVPLRGRGSATLAWDNLPASTFEFTGLAFPGMLDKEIKREGRLYEILHR
ncbi:MAG: hypothetical protein AB1916_13075 [Thermodesulfobacteriota bacterium]